MERRSCCWPEASPRWIETLPGNKQKTEKTWDCDIKKVWSHILHAMSSWTDLVYLLLQFVRQNDRNKLQTQIEDLTFSINFSLQWICLFNDQSELKCPPWLKASQPLLSLESWDERSHLQALGGSGLLHHHSLSWGFFEWLQSLQNTVDPLSWGASRRISRPWAVCETGDKHVNTVIQNRGQPDRIIGSLLRRSATKASAWAERGWKKAGMCPWPGGLQLLCPLYVLEGLQQRSVWQRSLHSENGFQKIRKVSHQ